MDSAIRKDCAVLGLDLNQLIEPQNQHTQAQDFLLWPEHWNAWNVYLGCSTQWRMAVGMGGVFWQGLDYQGVEMVMRRYRVPRKQQDQVFAEIQVLEEEEKSIRNSRED